MSTRHFQLCPLDTSSARFQPDVPYVPVVSTGLFLQLFFPATSTCNTERYLRFWKFICMHLHSTRRPPATWNASTVGSLCACTCIEVLVVLRPQRVRAPPCSPCPSHDTSWFHRVPVFRAYQSLKRQLFIPCSKCNCAGVVTVHFQF